ncbi:MAG: hypothetical protein ABFD15_06140 [Methanofastidiosum sp.]
MGQSGCFTTGSNRKNTCPFCDIPDFLTLIDRIILSNNENICMVALKEDLYGKPVQDIGDEVFAIVRDDTIIRNPGTEDLLQKGDKLIIVH